MTKVLKSGALFAVGIIIQEVANRGINAVLNYISRKASAWK